MKKWIVMILMLSLLMTLCACFGQKDNSSVINTKTASNDDLASFSNEASNDDNKLTLLTDDLYLHCNTQNGYYYISDEMKELKDGSYGSVIMYMDFATEKEVYLCSNTGCKHDTESCTAIISEDDFTLEFGKIFVYNNYLYLLNRGVDTDGTVSIDLFETGAVSAESTPCTLYRMNLDGMGREKIYTFDDGVTAEEMVMGCKNGLYFVTKELKDEINGAVTTTVAMERKIIRYDLDTGNVSDVASMELDGGSYWRIIGCADNSVVLEGVEYGESISETDDYTADEWSRIFGNSKTKYVNLNLSDGSRTDIYSVKNDSGHSGVVLDGKLYISEGASDEIIQIDLNSGTEKVLTALRQNNICDTVGDALVCRTWNMTEDYSLYFVDTVTGEISHSELVNQRNGWALELMGETEEDVLVIYDYAADELSDGAFEIEQYKYALISKDDLYSGRASFRSIDMIGRGR